MKMGVNIISMDGNPIENHEGALLSSAARTATATADFINGGARDLYVIVNVTAVGTVSGVAEVASLAVTAIPTSVGNITVTLNGVGQNIAVDPAVQLTTTDVATLIRGTAFAGWTTGGAGTTVTFTATATGTKTDATFTGGTTGVTGTMTTPTQGVTAVGAPSVIPKIEGKAFTSGALYSLGTVGTAITATGLYVYMYSKNAGTAHDGITAVFDSPLPKNMRLTMTHANGTSITYSVDYALCL
jgi:hypothetical protein